jgi:hypothetical protein
MDYSRTIDTALGWHKDAPTTEAIGHAKRERSSAHLEI